MAAAGFSLHLRPYSPASLQAAMPAVPPPCRRGPRQRHLSAGSDNPSRCTWSRTEIKPGTSILSGTEQKTYSNTVWGRNPIIHLCTVICPKPNNKITRVNLDYKSLITTAEHNQIFYGHPLLGLRFILLLMKDAFCGTPGGVYIWSWRFCIATTSQPIRARDWYQPVGRPFWGGGNL